MSRKASLNGIRHGVLSTKLILDGENIDDYQALLGDLLRELKSVGTLACSLVEKIAITLWRQRRLVNAESAAVDLSLNPRRIMEEVETGMGLSEFEAGTISPDDLRPWNQEQTDQLKWCKDVIAEYQSSDSFDLDSLAKKAPLISE